MWSSKSNPFLVPWQTTSPMVGEPKLQGGLVPWQVWAIQPEGLTISGKYTCQCNAWVLFGILCFFESFYKIIFFWKVCAGIPISNYEHYCTSTCPPALYNLYIVFNRPDALYTRVDVFLLQEEDNRDQDSQVLIGATLLNGNMSIVHQKQNRIKNLSKPQGR